MLSRLRSKALRVLDRPGRRGLLVVPGSLWVSATYRSPCLVRWRDGAWIHHYRGASIPHATLGRAAPPSVFMREARDLFLYAYTPQPGDVVFDVGAGIGAEALLFSRLVGPTGRVVSVEAHPRTYRRLADLCRANRLDNVTPLQLAVSDSEGEVSLADLDVHLQNRVVSDGALRVPARRIDTIAHELGVDRIDLLKMNIEGAERDAVRGLGALVAQTRNVVISCHDFLSDELRTKDEVRAFLVEHGFEVTTREDVPEPWTRDYLYGVKR
jgi:FkbM family methyltransferase